MTGTELGKIVDGVGRGTVSSWESDTTKPEISKLTILAAALGTDVDTLLAESGVPTTGKKKLLIKKSKGKSTTKLPVDAPPEGAGGLLPLITWEQVASWGAKLNRRAMKTEMLPCEVEHGPLAFYLKVVGDSNYVPNGEVSFQEGEYVAIDPERDAEHRNFVLAELKGSTLMLRQLIVEGDGSQFLKAINPGWPNPLIQMGKGDRIVGVVISKFIRPQRLV